MNGRFCVECRWCDLQFEPPAGSYFACRLDGKRLPSDVVSMPSCERFKPQPYAAQSFQDQWGP